MYSDAELATRPKGIMFDLDGVIWRGKVMLPGVAETLARLRQDGFAVTFVSNNSLLGRDGMTELFRELGISLHDGELVLATEVLAKALAKKMNRATVYLIGSEGLRSDLERQGLRVLREPEEIDYLTDFVVVGGDWDINYTKLTRALRCVRKGAKIAAPNADLTYPHEDGLVPGNGAFLAAVTAMARRPVDVLVGKPQPDILQAAMETMGLEPHECLMVGDTIEADVAAADAAGVRSVLVLSGNDTIQDVEQAERKPWRVIDGVCDLYDVLETLPTS